MTRWEEGDQHNAPVAAVETAGLPSMPLLFDATERRRWVGVAAAVAVVTVVVLGMSPIVDDPDPARRVVTAWALAALPMTPVVAIVAARPLLRGPADVRRFWRSWLAGQAMAVTAAMAAAWQIHQPGGEQSLLPLLPAAAMAALWLDAGVSIVRRTAGHRGAGVDLVDTAIVVVTLTAPAFHWLVQPVLPADPGFVLLLFAGALATAPAAAVLALTAFTRLDPGMQRPYLAAMALLVGLYVDLGGIGLVALGGYTTPAIIMVTLQALVSFLMVVHPLTTVAIDKIGLRRLSIGHQLRWPRPAVAVPAVVIPLNLLVARARGDDVVDHLWFVAITASVVLALTTVRSLLVSRETSGLYEQVAESARELEARAMEDELTGLANRRQINEALRRAVHRLVRSGGPIGVVYIDLDGFKAINDRFGHDEGDLVLVEVARSLRDVTRLSDCVGRLGGDEFVMVAETMEGEADADEMARRVLAALSAPVVTPTGVHRLSASVGVVLTADPTTSAQDLLREADHLMYEAKQSGKNRACVRTAGVGLGSGGPDGTGARTGSEPGTAAGVRRIGPE